MAATMAMDNSRQHHFSNGHMSYDNNQNNMHYSAGPQFTNPVWNAQQPSNAPIYAPMASHNPAADTLPRPGFAKQSNASLPGYPSMLNTSTSSSLSYGQQQPQQNYASAEQQPSSEAYSATAPSQHYTSSSPSHYNMSGYNSLSQNGQIRRPSLQPGSLPPAALPPSSTFGDPLLQHAADITPRNVYGGHPNERYAADSYGFPAPQSTHSSISAASSAGYPYYAGSVDSSATDYSSADSVDSYHSRGIPRLSGAHAMLPPAPQTMMGQFNSKMVSNAQKKHKCKVCDKRFTRPSSLQTHMYSHTGEKPFACDIAGCGRQFSVVSNLRRHKKVHKSGSTASDDHESESHDSHSEHEHASPSSSHESWIKPDHQ